VIAGGRAFEQPFSKSAGGKPVRKRLEIRAGSAMSMHYEIKESGESVAIPDEFTGTRVSAVRSRDGQRMIVLDQKTWWDLYMPRSFTAKQYLDSATLRIDIANRSVPIDHIAPQGEGPFLVEYHTNRIVLRTLRDDELGAYFDSLIRSNSF